MLKATRNSVESFLKDNQDSRFDMLLKASKSQDRFMIECLEREAFATKKDKRVKDFIRLVDNKTYFLIRGDVAAARVLDSEIAANVNQVRMLWR
jgi:hypothetical protein